MKTQYKWVPQGLRHRIALEAKGVCFHCKKLATRSDVSKRGHLRFFDENDNAYHIDHLLQRSKGGTDDKENLVLSCSTCNVGIRNKRALNDPEVLKVLKKINYPSHATQLKVIKQRIAKGDQERDK